MRRTKIHATLGPSSWDPQVLTEMMKNGMDGCRINFSHTKGERAEVIVQHVRQISRQLQKVFPIRQDLQGPKLRIARMGESPLLEKDERFILELGDGIGDQQRAFFDWPQLFDAFSVGDPVVLADGKIKLKILEKADRRLICKVIFAAEPLSSRKGIAAPGVRLNIPALTEKDKDDLLVGARCDVDVVSLSFVKNAEDVNLLRHYMAEIGFGVPIIAKIELRQSVEKIDEIIEAADGVSIARGDLQVEFSLPEIPFIQRSIIRKCNDRGKFVMMGASVMASMRENPVPVLADVSDVFLAVEAGPDTIALSDETAVGKYPIECIRTMDQIINQIEALMENKRPRLRQVYGIDDPQAAVNMAKSGFNIPIVTVQKARRTASWLAMHAGVYVAFDENIKTEEHADNALAIAEKNGLLGGGEELLVLNRSSKSN